ncbi:MAG: hypothetical protein HRT99_03430 [Mycoplasmatales bacterium]|nr:hypothetical protein [Mycoplasmatales bacterium]
MNINERQKIKEEIKKEIIEELKGQNFKGGNFDFEKYKKEVVEDDMKKMSKFQKTNKWYWYIPIIGFGIYMYQFGQTMTSIDRGLLRKNFNKAGLKYLWITIPFLYIAPIYLVLNYLPIIFKLQMKRGLELTKKENNHNT